MLACSLIYNHYCMLYFSSVFFIRGKNAVLYWKQTVKYHTSTAVTVPRFAAHFLLFFQRHFTGDVDNSLLVHKPSSEAPGCSLWLLVWIPKGDVVTSKGQMDEKAFKFKDSLTVTVTLTVLNFSTLPAMAPWQRGRDPWNDLHAGSVFHNKPGSLLFWHFTSGLSTHVRDGDLLS